MMYLGELYSKILKRQKAKIYNRTLVNYYVTIMAVLQIQCFFTGTVGNERKEMF